MTMLLGVLAFLCLPVVTGEISKFFQTDNATRLIPVASDSVFAGEQEGTTEYKVCMMLLICFSHSSSLYSGIPSRKE